MDWTSVDNSPGEIRRFLEARGLSLKKRWGQNFMINPGVRASIVSAVDPGPGDLIWEIGPGLGGITALLIARTADLVVFEIDHGIIRVLEERFGATISIVPGDAVTTLVDSLAVLTPPDLIVGNLPYRSAAPIVGALLEHGPAFRACRRMVFTVQREMARRMVAVPGSKDYSPLSVLCALSGTVMRRRDISPGSFFPVPEVVSSLISIELAGSRGAQAARPAATSVQIRTAGRCARALFSSRRKTIGNNVPALATAMSAGPADVRRALAAVGIDESARAETVAPSGFLQLAIELTPHG